VASYGRQWKPHQPDSDASLCVEGLCCNCFTSIGNCICGPLWYKQHMIVLVRMNGTKICQGEATGCAAVAQGHYLSAAAAGSSEGITPTHAVL